MQGKQVAEALAVVRRMRLAVGDDVRFRGYSGRARWLSGALVVAGAVNLSRVGGADLSTTLMVWGTVATLAALANVAALCRWTLVEQNGDWRALAPVRHMLVPLLVGATLTAGMVLRDAPDLLYGTWISAYGLANVASRRVLPREIAWIGMFYVVVGGLCLCLPGVGIGSIWVMAIVFGAGEAAAGRVLIRDHRRYQGLNEGRSAA